MSYHDSIVTAFCRTDSPLNFFRDERTGAHAVRGGGTG